MKPKWWVTGLVVLSMAGYFASQALGHSIENYPVRNGMADYAAFASLSEVEERADLIVQAQFTGDRETREIEMPGGGALYDSTSKVEVLEAFKGDLDLGITKMIRIIEPGAFHEESYVNDAGYNVMSEDGRFILFLTKVEDEEETYATVGGYQGKFDLNITDPARHFGSGTKYGNVMHLDYFGDSFERFNRLKDEVVAKYDE